MEFRGGKVHRFAHRTTRAATILRELLTNAFRGIVSRNRAKAYWYAFRP